MNGRQPFLFILPPSSFILQEEGGGRFRLRGARLSRLWEALNIQNLLLALEGVVDFDLTYRQGAAPDDTTGTGRVQITNVRYSDTPVSGRLAGDLRLRGQQLFLPELSGSLGDGQVRLRAGVFLRDLDRSWFNLTLENVEAVTLLGVFPDLRDLITGPLDANVRGNLGSEWRGDGEIVLARGRVLGAEVTEWRIPLHFEFSPERGSGRIDVRDSTAQVGLGRATGQLHLNWGAGTRLTGNVRFARVELRGLVKSIDSTLSVGAGRVTGRLDFSGQDVRSLNDVTARLQADLNETQALQYPVFRELAPYLGIPSSTSVQTGEVRAVLGRGVWRIQRLSLESDFLKLFARGTQTLQGRLNLEVVARTGQVGVNPAILRLLGVATVGPVPAAALVRASQWLSNRTLYLRVTGTLRSPTVRVEALPLLTEEAVRFFLFRYAPAGTTRDYLLGP